MNAPTALVEVKQPATSFSLVPQTLSEALELAKLIATSDLAPKDYHGKPGNVLIAVQMGQEVGLSPMSAIQSIAVINGKPSLYGDVGKALLLSNGFHIEEDDVIAIKKNGMGRCRITRPGHPPCERTFSIENAKTAGLWGKSGPWTNYPERQMAWRAFWFAARDIASDILKGLSGAEEAIDIPPRDITPVANGTATIEHGPQPYPAEAFSKNLPIWRGLIEKGTKTAEQIIATVSSKGTLTDEQKKQITGVNKQTGETTSLLDDVKRICAAALAIPDRATAFARLDDARVLLPEMLEENKVLAVKEIDAANEALKARE